MTNACVPLTRTIFQHVNVINISLIWFHAIIDWFLSIEKETKETAISFIVNKAKSNINKVLMMLACWKNIWAAPSEFVSSSIPSWQTLTAHAQPFRGARDLVFCLKVPLDSLLVWASSEGSGETARMRRLAWTFAARIGDKYQIRLARSIWGITMWSARLYSSSLVGHPSHVTMKWKKWAASWQNQQKE